MLWLAIIGVINSAVSAYYYVRIIQAMFLQPATGLAPEAPPSRSPAPWVALGVSGAAVLFMGVAPGFVMEAARMAARALAV